MADLNETLGTLAGRLAGPAFDAASTAARFSVLGDFILAGLGTVFAAGCAYGICRLYASSKKTKADDSEFFVVAILLVLGLTALVPSLLVLLKPLYWVALFDGRVALAAKLLGWL